jgi:putative ABC transport system permease protein
VPGIARIDPIRFERLTPEGSTGLLTVMARPVDAALLKGFQVQPPVVPARGGLTPVWVSEAAVDLFGWRAGQDVTIPLAGRSATFHVAGVFRDYARTWGTLLVDLAEYRALTDDKLANDIAIHLAPGADARAAEEGVAKVVAQVPGAELHDASFIHARALRIFDRTFAATYALEAAAILIALAGVTSSFAALAWSRRREFGVLRHLGLARGEVMRLLALEGGAAGIIGAFLGLLAGAAVSVVLVHVVNRQSFHWGMAIHWPWLALAILAGSVVLLCALGASAAGRAAVAREAVHAVKDDA